MTNLKTTALAAVLALTAGAASATTFTLYTDRADFEAALSGVTVYDFDTGAPASGVTITGDDVTFNNGRMRDVIDQGAAVDTTFAFDDAIFGFGGDFNLEGPGGPGTGITVTAVNGGSFTLPTEIPNTIRNGFWGFVADMAFSSVQFAEGSQANGIETYRLDNLTTGLAPVPLPAGLPLLLAGLGGMALVRRKRA